MNDFERMHLLKIICSNVIVLIHHCFGKALEIAVESRSSGPNEEVYYQYVPDKLQWHHVHSLCRQRSRTLAVITSAEDNQGLTCFLQSLNISQPVWIQKSLVPEISGSSDALILEFLGRSDHHFARLLYNFPSLSAVTVCTRLRFDPTCLGVSTVFSYSTSSVMNEFQLRATVTQSKPIKLALLVHGKQGTYQTAFANDASWHSVCVSWTGSGGEWAITVDGLEVGRGSHLCSSDHIGGGGNFIIGQDQGGSIKHEEAFCGSITQFYIWDRVLDTTEIQTMAKECSTIPYGLLFKWSALGLELEPSLQTHWGHFQCPGISGHLTEQLIIPWLNASLQYHNFSLEDSWMTTNDTCVTFDPTSGKWGWDYCKAQRGGVCQFHKEPLDTFGFPKTPLFTQVIDRFYDNPELEERNSTFSPENELIWLSSFAESIVRIIESNPNIITPSDLLYLAQAIELAAAAQTNETASSTEDLKSMATNYLNIASSIIDPILVRQWLDLKPLGLHLRPFMVVESIDKLLWTLADTIFAEKKTFTASTKNIDVHMEPRRLSQMSCSCVYKPSANHASSQDEIVIPETEAQRIYALGHKDVMFIHAYYSHLVEVLSQTTDDQQTEIIGSSFGVLASAVISATVRDVSRGQNVPVSVQYTLSTAKVERHYKLYKPVCIFWNVSVMAAHASDWSGNGCSVLSSGFEVTSCFCNHTTNFAVLMNYMEFRWSVEEESVLTKLTFIGSGASLCALLVTLMLFTVLDIPKSDRTSIHKNLFISLTFAQIVLLCGGSTIHNKVACTLVAALLHLFFMAAFSWMLVEGLLLWSKVVTVNLSEDRHMKYYYMIGWGLPVLIVTITLASASGDYTADGHCWLSVQNGVIWGFAGPVIFIIMVNIMVLTRVVLITIATAKRRSLMLAANTSPVNQVSEQIRSAIKAVLVLLPILGLTWLCGLLVPFSIIMAYIFILLNSLQGLFIFLIYGVYNTEIRNTLKRIKERRKAQNFSNCGSSRPSSSVTSSRQGSSPEPGPLATAGTGPPGTPSASSNLTCSHGKHCACVSAGSYCRQMPPGHFIPVLMPNEALQSVWRVPTVVTSSNTASHLCPLEGPAAGTREFAKGQLILPGAHGNLKEDSYCHSSSVPVTGEGSRVPYSQDTVYTRVPYSQETGYTGPSRLPEEQPLGGVADSCSLHVPVDAELMSCVVSHSSLQQHGRPQRL
ncbi:adhesion G protein-coupled receptor D2 isoform X2 [Brachyhypopomus gauderio]|uniref:adhesion G protein-coupled receptor D2 isoform X2 n=1 Tax=Brachyhypopomus gauderio TaxID=698409 RepID=UPI0040420881